MADRRSQGTAVKTTHIDGKDAVGLYLEAMGKNQLLSAEDEVDLAKAIEVGLYAERLLAGDVKRNRKTPRITKTELGQLVEQGRQAKQRFVTANLRLVVLVARRYGFGRMPLLDVIQEGNTGLIRAVEKFDYARGFKFSTYAMWWIRQSITRGIAEQSRLVRLPVGVTEKINRIRTVSRAMERVLGREPQWTEVAEEMALDVDRLLDLVQHGREHTSLDAPVEDHPETLIGDLVAREQTPGPDEVYLDSVERQQLYAGLATLDRRSADIIKQRYGFLDGHPVKVRELAARWNISAERVRQLERQAISQLRKQTSLAA